jgi:hypothetical protein
MEDLIEEMREGPRMARSISTPHIPVVNAWRAEAAEVRINVEMYPCVAETIEVPEWLFEIELRRFSTDLRGRVRIQGLVSPLEDRMTVQCVPFYVSTWLTVQTDAREIVPLFRCHDNGCRAETWGDTADGELQVIANRIFGAYVQSAK